MQAHLGADPTQRLRQKMRRSHPSLDRSKWVLDRLSPDRHFFGRLIELLLHCFEHALMFPPFDAL